MKRQRIQVPPPPPPPIVIDRHRTSDANGYILFLGQEGAGKSSAINFLFGQREISPVYREDARDKFLEFTTVGGENGKSLRILDTPGLGCCLERDAKVIATLKKYLDRDPELRNCIPQAIVIVLRFDDERLSIRNSGISQTLRAISLLKGRLFTKMYSNVIVLLPHFMSGRKMHKEDPKEKYKMINRLIRKNLRLHQNPYIISGENEAGDWGLPEVGESKGDYLLPSGEIYPANLAQHLTKITTRNKDEDCNQFIRESLANRRNVDLKLNSCLSLVSRDSSRFQMAENNLRISYEK